MITFNKPGHWSRECWFNKSNDGNQKLQKNGMKLIVDRIQEIQDNHTVMA